jgi:hypothetical protein
MAGRPRRRARLEAAERGELPEFPEPSKPVAEMTAAERAAYTTALRRALRDDEVRRGRRPPRSMREVEIWRGGQAAPTEQGAARIARAGRRQRRPEAGQEGPQSDE